MNSGLFWWLVAPSLVAAILTYLVILFVGLGTIWAAHRSAHPLVKGALVSVGMLVILSPLLFHAGMEMRAQHKADVRQADLAEMERVDLAGRLPARFIAVGSFRPELIDFIEARYRLSRYPQAENKRLVGAYRAYRRAERCHRVLAGVMMPGTKIPVCKTLPDKVQSALDLREHLLVFAEGRDTSLREDSTIAGRIYEIRLITPQEDLLVDYFEERTVEGTPSVFNPYASRRRLASDAQAPNIKAFIETAMQRAGR